MRHWFEHDGGSSMMANAKLWHLNVLVSQGQSVAEAVRWISVPRFTCFRWRKEFGGRKTDEVKRLKELEKQTERLRKAVSDQTLEKLILWEAASGNFRAPPAAVLASITSGRSSRARRARAGTGFALFGRAISTGRRGSRDCR